ncbi:ComEC/Rec2 family competence protein [Mycobacterium sp.]|uniref:ComEC/Rec2 family competence protein n=1 Tax=Mycobacterium sp. TaxID=1785 RepID=UPI003A8A3CA2
MVTAAGIVWSAGDALAGCGAAVAAVAGFSWWRVRHRSGARVAGVAAVAGVAGVSAGLVAVGVVGAGYGLATALRAEAAARHPITTAFGTAAPVTVIPSESAVSVGSGRLMFRATLRYLRADESSGRVVVFARAVDVGDVMAGRPVRFTARISRPKRRDLTVATLVAVGRPVWGRAGAVQRVAHIVRTRFAAGVRHVLPADQAAMLPALVLGDTSAVTATTRTDFRTAGMTHLTAVSGANVTIVCAAVLLSARLIGRRAAVVLAGLALVAFVVLVQPSASVLRAAVMGALTLAAMLSARRRQAIPALSATVLILLAVAPQLAVDVGFALSVAATAALVVIAPAWSRRLTGRGWPKVAADAFAVAAAAQMVTAPLVAGISGRFSVVAVAANLLVAPVIATITVLGTAAAAWAVLWPGCAGLLIRFTGPEVWWVLRVAHWAARVPGAGVSVPSGVAGLAVVGGATVLILVLWRWHWFRATVLWTAVAVAGTLAAWSVSDAAAGMPGVRAA